MPSKRSSPPGVRILLTGLAFGESPRWHDDRLWVSDWGAREIIAVDLEGKSEVIVPGPSVTFCIDFLPDGRLLIVSGREGRLLRREADGSLVTHADLTGLSDGKWNDIVVDGRGNAYVNDVGFNLLAGEKFAPGTVAVVTPRRLGSPGGGRPRIPQRYGRDARQLDADRGRVLCQKTHGLRHRG